MTAQDKLFLQTNHTHELTYVCIGVLSDMVAEGADDISTAILPHATALNDIPQNAKALPVLPKWRPRDGKDDAYELFRDALETALIDCRIDPAAVDYPYPTLQQLQLSQPLLRNPHF